MKTSSVKNSLKKSKNILKQKRKNDQAKTLNKNKFTIIALNFVWETILKNGSKKLARKLHAIQMHKD